MIYFGLVGGGGYGREVLPWALPSIRRSFPDTPPEDIRAVFVESEPTSPTINGRDVFSAEDFAAIDCDRKFFNVAVGNGDVRKTLADMMYDLGIPAIGISHDVSEERFGNCFDDGHLLAYMITITSNCTIGKFFQGGGSSYVGHACTIGDYVTFSPRVTLEGYADIGDFAQMGAYAVVAKGTPDRPIRIGTGATIGMGAVITEDVPDGATVVGHPARILQPRPAPAEASS